MFERIGYGFKLFTISIQIFSKYPKLLVPLLVTWCFYAPTVLFVKYGINPDNFSIGQIYLIVFAVVLFFAFILTLSCTILLEMIQQIKFGEKPSLIKSLGGEFFKDIFRTLPLVFIWAVIWFILLVLAALFSKKRSRDSESYSPEGAAQTLAGQGGSIVNFFHFLQDGLRMIVFLILPAIVWENVDFMTGIQKGLTAFKSHPTEFITSYLSNELGAFILFIPPAILFYIAGNLHWDPGVWLWYLMFPYLAFAWSYAIYSEQMSTAMLYLWDMTWRKQVELAKSQGKTPPNFTDIPMPDLLENTADLLPTAQIQYDPPIKDINQMKKDIWSQPT